MSKLGKQQKQSHLPSLRGILDANNCCRGAWALNDAQHSMKETTSAFEFTLERSSDCNGSSIDNNNNTFPISGKYKGWFDLKTQVPGQNQRYEDEFELKFENLDDTKKYKITGNGINNFGKFDVNGEMDIQGNLSMYRVYAAVQIKRAPKSNNAAGKKTKTSADIAAIAAANAATVSASREKRTPQPFVKCSDILREMMRNPASVWFSEPVDFVKLNIPDYPEIIKQPICFNDIKVKLDKGQYEGPYHFAEDVRLTFKNAMKYNFNTENHVHIAAKEMLEKFEERYRYTFNLPSLASIAETESRKKRAANSSSSSSSGPPLKILKAGPGPRGLNLTLPASATSNPNDGVMAMQKKMQQMQDEIARLKKQVTGSVSSSSNSSSSGSGKGSSSITFHEKQELVTSFKKLSPHQLSKIVDIIRAAVPRGGGIADGSDYLIPLDIIDDTTLIKLKKLMKK